MTNSGDTCLELFSSNGLGSAFVEEIGLKHETVSCHHGTVPTKNPPWIQGRSHGCTMFGFDLASNCETGKTASRAFQVALWFDTTVCHPWCLETSQTSRKQARMPERCSLDTATPHHDWRHDDLVCRGD